MPRRKLCQLIVGIWLFLTFVLTVYYTYQIQVSSKGPRIPKSSWDCSGTGRSRVCTVRNFCVDKYSGGFVAVDTALEQKMAKADLNINLINADQEGDAYYKPDAQLRQSLPAASATYYNGTLFVYGLYASDHYSHMLFNGLAPLYRTIHAYNKTKDDVWTYRAITSQRSSSKKPLMTTEFFSNNPDIVRDKVDLTSDQQMLLPKEPMCFSEAIIGAGNACSMSFYCENPIEASTYAALRDDAVDYYMAQDNWHHQSDHAKHQGSGRDDLACIENMETVSQNNGKPKRVVALINRTPRTWTNMLDFRQSLLDHKSDYDYTIKTFTFDEGCSVASSAYLTHDVDILITPHGSQEGAALFMKDKTTVISVDARGYSEDWFAYPFIAMGRRFYTLQCQKESCVEIDVNLANKVFQDFAVSLPSDGAVRECISWVNDVSPEQCILNFLPDIKNGRAREISSAYSKNVARKADIPKLLKLVNETMTEQDAFRDLTYKDICDQEKCCGFNCKYALETVMYGSQLGGRMRAWSTPSDPVEESKEDWIV